MESRMLKNYTALKLSRVDLWSKFQHSISNRSQVIMGEKKFQMDDWMIRWMDGKIKLIFSNISKRAQ